MRKLILRYMLEADIPSIKELARLTGIEYRRLLRHIDDPSIFKIYEIEALDSILQFNDVDILKILRGKK